MNQLRISKKTWIIMVLIALTASTIWTFMSVQTKLDPVPVQKVTFTASIDYEIESRKNLLVWPSGTVFKPDQAAYFYAANPKLTIIPKFQVSGMSEGALKGTVESQVAIQAVNDKSLIYWSYPLDRTEEQPIQFTKGSGELQELVSIAGKPLAIEVSAAYALVEKISKELDFKTGTYQISILSTIQWSGVVNGQKVEEQMTHTLTAVLLQSGFTILKPSDVTEKVIAMTNPKESFSAKEKLIEWITSAPYPFGMTAALMLLLFILVVVTKKTQALEAIEHKRFKEWITEGRVESNNWIKINILTLEGLVDLAIDLDKRVIYDATLKKYFVLADEMVYVYDLASVQPLFENKPQLGKLLIESGILSPEQLETGLYYQQKIGRRLGESIIALGFIDETTLYSILAAQQHINYFELNPEEELTETSWLASMEISTAKALQALPLGLREDGKWVVACSEPSKEGIQNTLREILGTEIILVASRPSVIYETLERLAVVEKNKFGQQMEGNEVQPYERLSHEEQRDFKMAYIRGSIHQSLLLKSGGFIDMIILSQLPEGELLLNWLVNKNIVQGELVSLMKGLNKAVESMTWAERQENKVPSLLAIMENANFLTAETVDWILRESALQELPVEVFLIKNHLASVSSVANAKKMLETLERIMNQSPLSNT